MEEPADENVIEGEEVDEYVEEEGVDEYVEEEGDDEYEEEKEEEEHHFKYKPSESLREMENNLSMCEKEFVKDDMVKETMSNMLAKSMKTTVAQNGCANLKNQWKLMLEGPEASRVVGTFGENLKKIMTTNRDANIINVVASTGHVLLKKMAVETRASGLEKILSMMFLVSGSSNTPHVINKIGQLTIMSVQKPRISEFTKRFFDETCNLLKEKNISKKMDTYFSNMISMMKNLHGQEESTTNRLV